MNERKWSAWWKMPELRVTFNYYPYLQVYRYGQSVGSEAYLTPGGYIIGETHYAQPIQSL
jgi:hypothetical protein